MRIQNEHVNSVLTVCWLKISEKCMLFVLLIQGCLSYLEEQVETGYLILGAISVVVALIMVKKLNIEVFC